MAILSTGLLFSGLLALLFALGELIARRRDRYSHLLFFVFFALAGLLLHAWGLAGGAMTRAPHFLGWYLPCLLALGPLMDRFIQLRLGLEGDSDGRRFGLHLLPAFACMAGLLGFLFVATEAKIAMIRGFRDGGDAPDFLPLMGLANLHLLAYIALSARRIMHFAREETAGHVRLHLIILAAAMLIGLLLLGGFVFPRTFLIPAGLFVLACMPPLVYLARLRFPDYFRELEKAVRRAKYANSQLKGRDLEEIERKLEELMLEEKLYREDDLTLPALAERTGLTSHQLSEFFNRHLEMNFAAFVNGHRIREARELLAGDPDMTVLAAAYQVGFNSKSSFNQAFSRETGLTPSAWRARRAKKERP